MITRMGIFSFLKRNKPPQIADTYYYSYGNALQLQSILTNNSTNEACINLIAKTISILPLSLYFRKNDGTRIKAYTHNLYTLVKNEPNPDETPETFIYRIVSDLLKGNAYIFKGAENDIYYTLAVLNATGVEIKVAGGQKYYKYEGKEYTGKDILHIPGQGYDGVRGYSPLDKALELVELTKKLNAYAINKFDNQLSSKVIYDVSAKFKNPTPDQIRQIADYVRRNYSGEENAGKPFITFDGMKIEKLDNDDNHASQLLENRQYQNKLIAQLYGVPLFLIGEGDNKYNSSEWQNLNFLQYCLLPWIRKIEQYFGKLLTPYERERYYFEFSLETFLRADSAIRYEVYQKQFQNGILSVNEIREKENLDGIGEEGDQHFFPANLAPLTKEVIEAYLANSKLKQQQVDVGKEQNLDNKTR